MIPILSLASVAFPDVEQALTEPNGLLAAGGDLSVARLIAAYQHGIFPWFTQGDPILWWSPHPRAVFWPSELHISRSLRKFIKKTPYRYTINTEFPAVIERCATAHAAQSGTWITPAMQEAYVRLHQAGYAHSIEVWQHNELVGGLYGVQVGSVFCGESMFHRADNASKCALLALAHHLIPYGLTLIDCQMPNPHLMRLGAQPCSRQEFQQHLQSGKRTSLPASAFLPQPIDLWHF